MEQIYTIPVNEAFEKVQEERLMHLSVLPDVQQT